ncbi:HNH endonuclease signature motif containing protein [Bradyrhizobium sp. SZCCHNG3015]|uniref:HNH endonuclease signature motif containing protein n=1 Tax=Bradyrhizobium sp. SZCCHNG3015 TaxID=3057270 RepID=UPI0039657B83
MCLDGGTMAVHIVMYVLEHGPIPPRKQLDHRCRARRCVNADHLEMVTHKENQRRRDEARRFACEEIAA